MTPVSAAENQPAVILYWKKVRLSVEWTKVNCLMPPTNQFDKDFLNINRMGRTRRMGELPNDLNIYMFNEQLDENREIVVEERLHRRSRRVFEKYFSYHLFAERWIK